METHDRHREPDLPDEGWGPHLHLFGVSFRTAPAPVRDTLTLDDHAARRALLEARGVLTDGEALVLSTGNRTELYAVGSAEAAMLAWHRHTLPGRVLPTADCPAADAYRYHLEGRAAARHLFRVVAGLESAVPGDQEIVGQVRAAARRSDELGLLGTRLRLVVDHALRTSTEARSETSISTGGARIGTAVADLVMSLDHPGARVTIVGAGEAARAIARELHQRTDVELRIVNRTLAGATALAERYRGRATSLDGLTWSLLVADVVIAATGAPDPIITPALLAEVRSHEPRWAPVIVDIGLPRNVDPTCDLPVVNLETLSERSRPVARRREAAVADAERCVEDGLVRWHVIELRRRIRQRLGQLGMLDAAS